MKSLLKRANETLRDVLTKTGMQVRMYVSADHTQHMTIMFPDNLVPPVSITMEPGIPGLSPVVFWYNPEMPAEPKQGVLDGQQ
jgi:hypothetical protein